jgi:hypothetical protein
MKRKALAARWSECGRPTLEPLPLPALELGKSPEEEPRKVQ